MLLVVKLIVVTVFCLNVVFCSICASGDQKSCNAIDKGHIITEETISKILIDEENSMNFSYTKNVLNFKNFTGIRKFTKEEDGDFLESEKGELVS